MSDVGDATLSAAECAHMPLAAWFGDEQVVVRPLGRGHINSTYLVRKVADADQEDAVREGWVLQGLSAAVFQRPQDVMANLERLTRWVEQAPGRGSFQPTFALPELMQARDGTTLVPGGDNPHAGTTSLWRLTRYIDQSRALQELADPVQAEAAGKAFGQFQGLVRGLPAQELKPVIAGFLDLASYLNKLDGARLAGASDASGEKEASLLRALDERRVRYQVGASPQDQTIIHGDCKVNNLLFAAHDDSVLAILDLDTLMVGQWWLDYGDLVRSASLSNAGKFDPALFAGLAKGFFDGRGGLRKDEVESALAAPAHLAYMLSVRFLTDHLDGDRYFKVAARGENLQRAQAQFAQLTQLEAAHTQMLMRSTLEEIAGGVGR